MADDVNVQQKHGSIATFVKSPTLYLLGRFAKQFADTPMPFHVVLPDGSVERFGRGTPSFKIVLRNKQGLRAIASMDEGRIGDAFLENDLDIEGDMLKAFSLKDTMSDVHPIVTAWRFIQPFLFGQVHTNQRAITSHYDIDPKFFLSLLDPKVPMYTQGVYETAAETLEAASLRKFDYCFRGCKLKPGDHMLEVGPGWGAWMKYASERGVKCTGISISQYSIDYLNGMAKELGRDWELIYTDLLAYQTDRKYDAIVIMGVIEHLPQYDRVLAKFQSMLKPGGNIFLDGSANTKKYEISTYLAKHIYPGNHSFLILHDFLEQLAKTPLKAVEIFNDRFSYYLTFVQWARNFDGNRDQVIAEFGERNYRRFRLYLWGAAYEFLHRNLDCYRMILNYPGPELTS